MKQTNTYKVIEANGGATADVVEILNKSLNEFKFFVIEANEKSQFATMNAGNWVEIRGVK